MDKSVGTPLHYLANLTSSNSAMKRQLDALSRPENIHKAAEIIAPVGLGLALGAIFLFARGLPSQWAGLIVLATLAPTVALLVNDMRKLLLVVLVVDIPLGLDISLADQPGHKGGPAGFLVSLMTMALVVGYALWLTNRPAGGKSKLYTHKSITVPVLVYLFILLVSAFQATEVWFSFTQLFLEVQFLLMCFYVINHVKTWTSVRLIFTLVVVCLLFESTLMLLQYFIGFELSALGITSRAGRSNIASATARLSGTLGSPNTAATYLAASLVITFAAYLTDNRLANRKLALIALLLGVAALVTTQSRSGWSAFAVALLVLVARALRSRLGVKALLLLLIVAVALGAGFSTQIVDRFTTDDRGSAESRVWQSKMAFNIIADHMFTGIGLNNLWLVMDDYLPLELMGRERNIIHNKYLTIWTETGLFGFLAFLWLLLAAGRRALQTLIHTKDAYASMAITGLLAALAVYLLHMSSDPFGGRRMQFFWLILALIAATSQIAKKTEGLEDPILHSKKPTRARPATSFEP